MGTNGNLISQGPYTQQAVRVVALEKTSAETHRSFLEMITGPGELEIKYFRERLLLFVYLFEQDIKCII